nr:ATPase, T2SS/T4P/T4SS family [Microbacterium proteolyticum]
MSSLAPVHPIDPASAAWRDPALAFLRPFLDDPAVTDLFINGDRGLFVDRGDGVERVSSWRASETEVRHVAVRLIALGGRHLDDASPCVDVRLHRGVRVHAVLAPVAASGTTLSVRVPRWDAPDLSDLERSGMLSARQREPSPSQPERPPTAHVRWWTPRCAPALPTTRPTTRRRRSLSPTVPGSRPRSCFAPTPGSPDSAHEPRGAPRRHGCRRGCCCRSESARFPRSFFSRSPR